MHETLLKTISVSMNVEPSHAKVFFFTKWIERNSTQKIFWVGRVSQVPSIQLLALALYRTVPRIPTICLLELSQTWCCAHFPGKVLHAASHEVIRQTVRIQETFLHFGDTSLCYWFFMLPPRLWLFVLSVVKPTSFVTSIQQSNVYIEQQAAIPKTAHPFYSLRSEYCQGLPLAHCYSVCLFCHLQI